MSKEKLYFESIDDTFCRPLSYYLHDAKLEGKKHIELVEAELDTETKEVIWCAHYGDCV